MTCVSGVHAICGRGPSDRGYGRTQSAGVGPEEHGICPAETRVQPEVSDTLHTSVSKQTGQEPGGVKSRVFNNSCAD